MPRLYVAPFDDNGTSKYAIYDDRSDPPRVFTDDFRPVVFETKDKAEARLQSYEEERAREDQAVSFSLDDAKKYAESHAWKLASTYAKTAPHEYLLKKKLVAEDQLLYERFVATMRANSVVGYFYGHKNDYLILGDYYYWFMPLPDNCAADLINRTTTDNLEYRDGAYYYKGK